LDIEELVSGWDCSPLHFHPTLPGMLSPTLRGCFENPCGCLQSDLCEDALG